MDIGSIVAFQQFGFRRNGEEEIAIISYSILMALFELHSRNILHRDIKVR